jgi:exopolysaccharide biosynthesis polyprenyl glycosylphosphotransferase
MLKHRQKGLEELHGALLILIITATFLFAVLFVDYSGWIEFTGNVRWEVYLLGVIAAMAWVHLNLRGVAARLGALSWLEVLRLTSHQVTRIMVVLFTLAFVMKDVDVSRIFLMGFVLLSAVILWISNTWLPPILARLFFREQRLATVIVSSGQEALRLQLWLAARTHLGVKPIGYVAPSSAIGLNGVRWLGPISQLRGILTEFAVDQVMIEQNEYPPGTAAEIVRMAEHLGCRVNYYVSMKALFGAAVSTVEHDDGYAFASTTPEPLDIPFNRVLKRTLDILLALPVVLLVMPVLTFVVWIFVLRQSPGPVFYRQLRSGINRRRFFIYKFRTMHVAGEEMKAKQATQNDSRVFPFGRFLRRTSLDEVPQFVNVLLGDMSVNGPRPHLLEHDEQFSKIVNGYYQRHFVKPGITGLAQSKGLRGELRAPSLLKKRVKYDMIYVAKWSLLLDCRILVDTALQIIFPPRTAY